MLSNLSAYTSSRLQGRLTHLCKHHRAHLCGYDVNLTYPQETLIPYIESTPRVSSFWSSVAAREQTTGLLQRRSKRDHSLSNQLDPYYGCSIFDEVVDYAANFSYPWCTSRPFVQCSLH